MGTRYKYPQSVVWPKINKKHNKSITQFHRKIVIFATRKCSILQHAHSKTKFKVEDSVYISVVDVFLGLYVYYYSACKG